MANVPSQLILNNNFCGFLEAYQVANEYICVDFVGKIENKIGKLQLAI